MKDIKKMTAGELGSMLHATLFAYEKVFLKFFGKEEARRLFAYLIEELIPILYNEKNLVIDKALSIEENMERLQHFLSNDSFLLFVYMAI